MRSFRLRLVSRIDKKGNRYFFCTTKVPISIDLSNTVFNFYTNKNEDGEVVGELVTRFYEDHPPPTLKKEGGDE